MSGDSDSANPYGASDAPGAPEFSHPLFNGWGGGPAVPEGFQALAGSPLSAGSDTAPPEALVAALRTVHDPEIPVNLYDLGLIYECGTDDKGDCDIIMTLTAPACPVAGELPQQVADAVAAVAGVGVVCVTLTWSPAWKPDMMSEDARMALDLF